MNLSSKDLSLGLSGEGGRHGATFRADRNMRYASTAVCVRTPVAYLSTIAYERRRAVDPDPAISLPACSPPPRTSPPGGPKGRPYCNCRCARRASHACETGAEEWLRPGPTTRMG